MSVESQANDVIAKELVIATLQSMEISKTVAAEEIPDYVSNLYKTVLKAVNEGA